LSSADAPPAEETTEEASEAAAVDESRQALLDSLTSALGDAIVVSHIKPGDDLWVRIRTDAWLEAGEVARYKLGFSYFDFLSALDWRPSPFGRYEDAEVDTPFAEKLQQPFEQQPGYTGGDTRYQVFSRIRDVRGLRDLTLKVDVPDDTMTIDSWVSVYAGASWHERETWEMFGITFEGHGDLRHIYLPSDFEGHPLRKDYPLLARVVKPWPGIVDVEPMPGEAEGEGEDATDTEGGDDG
jgi:NADH-quinone oxidoreductase subunit C